MGKWKIKTSEIGREIKKITISERVRIKANEKDEKKRSIIKESLIEKIRIVGIIRTKSRFKFWF